MSTAPAVPDQPSVLQQLFAVRRDEWQVLGLALLYFLLLMAGYFILRPIRDQMGVAGGIRNLPWLFTATLLATLVVSPLFSLMVSRMPRRRFVAWSYRLLMLCLLLFYAALSGLPESAQVWVGRAFFVWVSVFNLFAVSVFWAVMADVFHSEQSRRLYGVIAAGGTLGALIGGVATSNLVNVLGAPPLLLISLVLLELALWCMFAITRRMGSGNPAQQQRDEAVVGGSALDGFRLALRSPYLLGVCGYMLLYTIGSTFLYFLQAQVVDATIDGQTAQTAYFANVDIWVNSLTLVFQVFITGRLMAKLGVGLTLAALPLISIIGFMGLGMMPVLVAVVVFTVARRVTNFAFSRPSREALYVPLPREAKYKAKNLIDTFVYRVGDQVGAWANGLLLWLGFGITGIAFTAVPLAAAWLVLALWLGRRYRCRLRRYAA
ncbi:MAG: MFS transporter [Xanthomonadaceae bacterium]|nr:MFS transporter [Xanthomonadaceae bacterium]MDP2186796.1 MFS transporter [Xanthomonadales bacterium]MDZ4117513.1 MFS transporter [Xanthomonadaceae bacterium]MDZ4378629.1 MFS transporter [Xanthomonadaceae bacterium]